MIESDGVDDVCISMNSSPSKVINYNATFNNGLPVVGSSVLCAKASMLQSIIESCIVVDHFTRG